MTTRERLSVASRVSSAIVGSALLAIAASLALALSLPEPRRLGTALGVTLVIPFWVGAMCPGFLARSPWKPWAIYLGSSGLLAVWAWLRH